MTRTLTARCIFRKTFEIDKCLRQNIDKEIKNKQQKVFIKNCIFLPNFMTISKQKKLLKNSVKKNFICFTKFFQKTKRKKELELYPKSKNLGLNLFQTICVFAPNLAV